MKEFEAWRNCDHEWVQGNTAYLTNPPMYDFICRKCLFEERKEVDHFLPDEYSRLINKKAKMVEEVKP